VFLLSLKAGAAGLTLTQASRVILLEPALDPAVEQQAVARVHRIGQTRPVTITRLIVDGTVEVQVGSLAGGVRFGRVLIQVAMRGQWMWCTEPGAVV